MIKILFVCTANHDRSPTAEHIYRNYQGIEARSAGISGFAHTPVTKELLEWADVIFCMESYQRRDIIIKYPESVTGKSINDLNIPDDYEYGEPKLIRLIEERMAPWLAEYRQCGLI